MKCSGCKKENPDGMKFCKYCGSPLGGNYKTCPNGHNYEASKSVCPYCPPQQDLKTLLDGNSWEKTIIDKNSPSLAQSEKTILDRTGPVLKAQQTKEMEKTIIYNSNPVLQSGQSTLNRKLVGWLVTYDLDPNGKDFRITEGRHTIGRSQKADICLNSSSVTEHHATLLYRGGKFLIKDELSTNGTYVNDQIIESQAEIQNDDIIKIGNITLKLKVI